MENSLLDICDIDCKNLNLDILKQILTENELKKVNETCSNPIINNVVKSETDTESILKQMNKLLDSEPIPTPPTLTPTLTPTPPTPTPPTPTPPTPSTPTPSTPTPPTPTQPTPPIQPVPPIQPANQLGPKLLTAPLTTRINKVPLKPSTSLKSFAASFTGGSPHLLFGGSSLIGINISINKITTLLNVTEQQSQIMTYYYNNETETINNESIPKVLNMDELILIDAALKYYDFIEKKYESIFDVINSDNINSIPQEFRYNFYDIIIRDKNISNEQINQFNAKVNNIKKLMYNLKMRNQNNITFEPLNKYIINVSKSVQTGGKNKNIVEEEINDKIRRLSDYLKKQKKHKQKGGASLPEVDEIKKEIDTYETEIKDPALTSDVKKQRTKQIIQRANQWVNTLLILNVAKKVIVDNDFGIAIFKLEKTQELDSLDNVIKFVNEYASVLNFKNKDRDNNVFPEVRVITKIGNAKPTYFTDKLETYFQNRYNKLQNKKIDITKYIIVNANEPLPPQVHGESITYIKYPTREEAIKLIDLFKVLLNVQSGGGQPDYILLKSKPDPTQLIESCFTSRQYTKFMRIMTDYLKVHNQDINKPEFDKMKKDLETLQDIEKKLVDLYTIFNNYKKINDQFPQNIQKPVTVEHIKATLNDNNILIDKYGVINNNIIYLVKDIEKYLILTENIAEVKENPNLKMELDNLLKTKTQSGGASLQQVKKFTPFKEDEYFTTDTFKKILKEMNS
jgi:hypothetical protein